MSDLDHQSRKTNHNPKPFALEEHYQKITREEPSGSANCFEKAERQIGRSSSATVGYDTLHETKFNSTGDKMETAKDDYSNLSVEKEEKNKTGIGLYEPSAIIHLTGSNIYIGH